MRFVVISLATLTLTVSAGAQQSPGAAYQLQKSNPSVEWNKATAKVADVDCDGKPDSIMLGSEPNSVVVGLVFGDSDKKPQVLRFQVRRDTQDGFCGIPSTIETSPLKCESDGGSLPGCKPIKGCMAFSVRDPECDSLNFYWDATHSMLAWWRH